MLNTHRQLNELCHRLDPDRLTVLACFASCLHTNRTAHITDVVSWNLYLGWYAPGLFLNDVWLKLFHFLYPKRCIGYSEYGAEAMTNLHAKRPKRLTTPRNIRRYTTNTCSDFSTATPIFGQRTYGICSTSAPTEEIRAATRAKITRDL